MGLLLVVELTKASRFGKKELEGLPVSKEVAAKYFEYSQYEYNLLYKLKKVLVTFKFL
jgi:hypothetical protein